MVVEFVLNIVVIHSVKHTDRDWLDSMKKVEGVGNGTYNYSQLRADTGPLVYPAGFVWLYLGLYYISAQGTNILLAQESLSVLHKELFFFAKIL